MLVTDKLIYLQLQKTGSTYVGEMLARGLNAKEVGKHQPLNENHRLDVASRTVLGSIRDPYDWYVSLWGYSCRGRGELYDRTAGNSIRHSLSMIGRYGEPEIMGLKNALNRSNKRSWADLYSDANSLHAFEEWIRRLHSEEGRSIWRHGLLGVKPDQSLGIYTHWYRRCYWYRFTLARRLMGRPSRTSRIAVEHLIRLEHLEEDLSKALLVSGYDRATVDATLQAADLGSMNASDRQNTDAYFNPGLRSMVERLDREIFVYGGYDRSMAVQ